MGDADGERRPGADQAFVAVRYGDRSWVVDLPTGEAPFAGPDDESVVRIEGQARAQGLVRWDGDNITLERTAKSPPIYVNGKRLAGRAILKPGDELSIGDARMVVGLASMPHQSGRRAFTHQEFRERLAEELARAARRGRPTTLAMVQARSGEGGKVIEAALSAFRAGDVVATYAHDELELLFPDTFADDASSVLTRVLGDNFLASGIAVAPHDADTPERLIRSARLALTAAQRSEGERVSRPPLRNGGPKPVAPMAQDAATLALVEQLGELADRADPVLLTGEASCGKGVFARILHDRSGRADAPYVVLRCASLVDQDRITQALGPRGGLPEGATCEVLESAGGTLVLDEVCELPPDPQERLLDVLDVLGTDSARLVATTHLDLASLAKRGAFSEPLLELLRGEEVAIPPLRERPDDIVPLAEDFARSAGAPDPVKISPGALARLRSHPWPGNILELRNAMERAVRLASGGEILAEHLPTDSLPVASGEGRLREHVDSIERDAIVKALADSNHNQTHAARRLGISRRALIYKMEKYGLKPPPGSARR